MNAKLANAIIATSYNRYFGGEGHALNPTAAAKLSKGDKLGLLRAYINKNNSELYSIAQAESAFAFVCNSR